MWFDLIVDVDVATEPRFVEAGFRIFEITAEVEVLEAREDKPITRLRTTVSNQDGTVVLDGTALVWTEPI